MKKIILFLTVTLGLLLTLTVRAQSGLSGSFGPSSPLNNAATNAGYQTTDSNNALALTSTIISAVLTILGTVFIILIIYGGVIWMLSEGNEQRVERAGNIIRQAIIGLLIVVGAYGISYTLLKMFAGQIK